MIITWATSPLFTLCSSTFLDNCEDIIMGTHKEGGATTFWSYSQNLPLSSNAIISWKFCYLLHKILRDGHKNVSSNCRIILTLPSCLYDLFFLCLPLFQPFLSWLWCIIYSSLSQMTYRVFEIPTDTAALWKTWEFSGWVAITIKLQLVKHGKWMCDNEFALIFAGTLAWSIRPHCCAVCQIPLPQNGIPCKGENIFVCGA